MQLQRAHSRNLSIEQKQNFAYHTYNMSDNLIQDPAVQKVLNEVYEHTNSINWAIFIYSDIKAQKAIKLMASGTGGVSEALSFLTNEDIYYCYLRIDLQDGASTSAKFVFFNICW